MTPVSITELSEFTPKSLTNVVPKPVFRFRPPSPRARRRYQHALISEGLRHHSEADIENETLVAMRELWIGDEAALASNESRMVSFFETIKQQRVDPTVHVDTGEARTILEAMQRLSDAWPRLRQMGADNARFNGDAPKIALGMFLAGWSNMPTPFRLEDGIVPLDTLDALETDLDVIEAKAAKDNVEGVDGTAFLELSLHALSLMKLNTDTEKNLPSPSSSPDTLNGLTADGLAASPLPFESVTTSSPPAKSRKAATTPENS